MADSDKVEKPAKPVSSFENVENYLKSKYEIRTNVVSNKIEYRNIGETEYKNLNPDNLYIELQKGGYRFSQNNLAALLRSSFVETYDPIQEYFDALPVWDGKADHIAILCSHIHVKDQSRFNNHFRKMLVRSIACSLGKSFNKHAFVLIGGQNSGKTTFTRWLCPDRLSNYIAENISTDKDSLIALAENMFIVLDELATLQKAELNALKSFFTKDKIKVRRPYDRGTSEGVRRANFLGSTNKEEFLSDETGSVRWLCFEVENIVFDYSTLCNIDEIWSQAYALFKQDFKYQLTQSELVENEIRNSDFRQLSNESELIQKHFAPGSPEDYDVRLSATDIAKLLADGYKSFKLTNRQNIGKALTSLGFIKENVRDENYNHQPRKLYYIKYLAPFTTL